MKKPDPFALRGECVTGPDGAVVCRVARPLWRHTLVSPADFTDWRVPIPVKGDTLDRTPGFRTNAEDGLPQVCIEGEWRP